MDTVIPQLEDLVIRAYTYWNQDIPLWFYGASHEQRQEHGRELLSRLIDDDRFFELYAHLQFLRRATEKLTGPPITKRNLLVHVCAMKGDRLWKWHLDQLRDRREVFSGGRKVAAVASGDGLIDHREVMDYLAYADFKDFLVIPNDRELREVMSFLPLLVSIQSTDPEEATFYCHTKGNSTAENRHGAFIWAQKAYEHLLNPAAVEHLEDHVFVGIHKMIWPNPEDAPYPSRLITGNWMLAGTFFWFRHDRVFSHPGWRQVRMDRYGAEAWPSSLFAAEHAKSVYQLWPESQFPTPNPYDPETYNARNLVDDARRVCVPAAGQLAARP